MFENLKLQKILVDNGLNDSDTYTGMSKAFELACASLYTLIVTSANISEGSFSVSASDKKILIDLANGIYNKYQVISPLAPKIRNASNRW
jgi:hypothetical protein